MIVIWFLALTWLAILVFLTPNPARWVIRSAAPRPVTDDTVSILVSARNEESRVLIQAIQSMGMDIGLMVIG